jgi:drug/metabolite transporter (DMT)-like permease
MKQAVWMVLASLAFSCMGVLIKIASVDFNTAELVAYRGALSAAIIFVVIRFRGGTLKTTYPTLHIQRSVIGVLSLAAWFYSIGGLPLSTAMTLNYMSSIWLAAFLIGGALMLRLQGVGGQKDDSMFDSWLILTVCIGFAGVGLILRPTIAQNQLWHGFVGLLSGISAAIAYIQVAALGRVGEPSYRVVFYFSLCAAIGGGIAACFLGWSTLTLKGLVLLVPMGLLAVIGQVLLTRAYSGGTSESTLTAACLQYTGVLFSAVFGVLIFSDVLTWHSWFGMSMIVASGVAATLLRKRSQPALPDEER